MDYHDNGKQSKMPTHHDTRKSLLQHLLEHDEEIPEAVTGWEMRDKHELRTEYAWRKWEDRKKSNIGALEDLPSRTASVLSSVFGAKQICRQDTVL